ncbi:MAG: NAD(P)-dependent oxidoreductase [Candidatus Tectomicrobia bacterium]|uniref:NAD(P)-dependent oxidoreductase n=1 Tax=Tectimicrobiota bacterium TaxID=2528274 RepID=A0A932HY12_UNCTE|nr:NAD(P)-dependent oxidoreductase [Candidatus Tectomicrobia bacterium]
MPRGKVVGLIGIGRMGLPIAIRYSKAGWTVLGRDIAPRQQAAFARLKGARKASLAEIARECPVVLFCVPSSKEVASCLKGRDGLLANASGRLVIYDLTTSDPLETRKNARAAGTKGHAYLDAGMSGGPGGILEGKLTLMLGGDKKVFERTKAVFGPFTSNLFHLGEVGAGHAMKLLNNMVLHTIYLATCEAARLAEKLDLSVADMIRIFNVSTAYSYISRHRFPNNILNGSWNAAARVYNPYKDVGIAVKLGRKLKARIPHAEETYAFLAKAVKRGMIEKDYSLLYKDFGKIQRVRLGKK